MPDLPQGELDRIARDRARIFTPAWFADLLAGRLGPGDSFWLGNFGVLIGVVPALTLVAGLVHAIRPEALAGFLLAATFAAMAVWQALVLRALLRVRGRGRVEGRARQQAPGGWVMAGLVWTGLVMLACAGAAVMLSR